MAGSFEYKGFRVITSLSHGLLGPLLERLRFLARLGGSPNVFVGRGDLIGGFPDPARTVLAAGCTREALFDESLPEEERGYRRIFGDRVMMEVQAYVKRIPPAQVSFRDPDEDPGDPEALLHRTVRVLRWIGLSVNHGEEAKIRDHLAGGGRGGAS